MAIEGSPLAGNESASTESTGLSDAQIDAIDTGNESTEQFVREDSAPPPQADESEFTFKAYGKEIKAK